MYKFWVKRIEVKGSLHGSALESRSGIIRLKDEGETESLNKYYVLWIWWSLCLLVTKLDKAVATLKVSFFFSVLSEEHLLSKKLANIIQ